MEHIAETMQKANPTMMRISKMNTIENLIYTAVETAEKQGIDMSNCYFDENGIPTCRTCGKRKRFRFHGKLIPCQCDCDQKAEEEEKARIKKEQRIKQLLETGVTDKKYLENTFDKDDGSNPQLSTKCKKYVEKWREMKKNGIGILFYGDVGTGKSFFACCIGNALIEKGIPVLITNLSKLVENRVLSNKKGEDAVDLNNFALLIIDDLGIENATQTAYNIVDDWYRTGRPLIITTNLAPSQLKEAKDIQKRRIYDRVIEMCGSCPIKVNGEQRRYKISRQKRELAEILLSD